MVKEGTSALSIHKNTEALGEFGNGVDTVAPISTTPTLTPGIQPWNVTSLLNDPVNAWNLEIQVPALSLEDGVRK